MMAERIDPIRVTGEYGPHKCVQKNENSSVISIIGWIARLNVERQLEWGANLGSKWQDVFLVEGTPLLLLWLLFNNEWSESVPQLLLWKCGYGIFGSFINYCTKIWTYLKHCANIWIYFEHCFNIWTLNYMYY